jgi:hypothetical protein
MYMDVHMYLCICIYIYMYIYTCGSDLASHKGGLCPIQTPNGQNQRSNDDDDVYLRLQHGKGFHNLV